MGENKADDWFIHMLIKCKSFYPLDLNYLLKSCVYVLGASSHLNAGSRWFSHSTKTYSLGQRNSADLSDQLFVVQNWRVPLQLQEVQQLPHFILRVKHELLVADGQTPGLAGCLALVEHGLHRAAPLGQAVPVAGKVEARDGHLRMAADRWGTRRKPRTILGLRQDFAGHDKIIMIMISALKELKACVPCAISLSGRLRVHLEALAQIWLWGRCVTGRTVTSRQTGPCCRGEVRAHRGQLSPETHTKQSKLF